MKLLPMMLAGAVLLPFAAKAQIPLTMDARVGIGAGETDAHSHLSFPGMSNDLVAVHATVTVDFAVPVGLNFFAIQVNFPNKTWAHGGPQLVNNRMQANWGGLMNRGGGSADYKLNDPAHDCYFIQGEQTQKNTNPFAWAQKTPLTIEITRGKQVTLPAGDYQVSGKTVPVPDARTMWEWNLTITPQGGGPVYKAMLYDSSDRFGSFYVWNESGYGSVGKGQHATWSGVEYKSLSAPDAWVMPKGCKRF